MCTRFALCCMAGCSLVAYQSVLLLSFKIISFDWESKLNDTITPTLLKHSWRIWVNKSHQSTMIHDINKTKHREIIRLCRIYNVVSHCLVVDTSTQQCDEQCHKCQQSSISYSNNGEIYKPNIASLLVVFHMDGLVQERRNSSALAMELRLSCTNPSI